MATKEEILDAIAGMSVMDVVELVKMMEDKFCVSAAGRRRFGCRWRRRGPGC
jgi:ribosomal protein L7/L12